MKDTRVIKVSDQKKYYAGAWLDGSPMWCAKRSRARFFETAHDACHVAARLNLLLVGVSVGVVGFEF